MKTTLATSKAGVAALFLSLLVTGGVAAEGERTSPEKDIVDTAVAAGSFETLVAAVQAAGLVDALKGEGPLTVFAPTDEAFAKLPPGAVGSLLLPENRETLIGILIYHVAPGRHPAAEVSKLDHIETLNGQRPKIRIQGESVMIDGATVIAPDIMASNGVIHVIDKVILPNRNDIVTTAVNAGSFETLVTALGAADLVSTMQGQGPFTVFAPNDDAFAKLPEGTLERLLRPENKEELAAILSRHVISGLVYSADAREGRLETLEGSSLNLSRADGDFLVDDARIIASDIAATNGVIHVIDSVLLPQE